MIRKNQAIIYKGDFFRSMIFLHRLWLAIFVRETRMTPQATVLWYLQHTELRADFRIAYLLSSLGIKEDHKKIPACQNSSESWGLPDGGEASWSWP